MKILFSVPVRVNGIAPRSVDIRLTKVTKQPPQRRAGAVAGIPTGSLDTPLDMPVSHRSWLRRWRATSPRRRPSSTAA